MFIQTDSTAVLGLNLSRTGMLIKVMEKIKAMNRIYQNSPACNELGIEHAKAVKRIQDKELEEIEEACALHAIVSLPIAFEAYCKELIQELLSKKPEYFIGITTQYSDKLNALINDPTMYGFEDVSRQLRIRYRYDYLNFFEDYNIPFFHDNDAQLFLEQIYELRNHIVHDSGKNNEMWKMINGLMQQFGQTYMVSTLAKRMRTKFSRVAEKADRQVRNHLGL